MWTKISVGAVAAVVIGIAGWWGWPSKEPVYEGKRVRKWVDDWMFQGQGGHTFRDAGEAYKYFGDAFKYFGTNAIPYVRTSLRARDTRGRKILLWSKPRAPWLKIRVRPAWEERFRALVLYQDILDWDAWGDARAMCAPEVLTLINEPDPRVKAEAQFVLAKINSQIKKHE